MMILEEAIRLAELCWDTPRTRDTPMDQNLAHVFAELLVEQTELYRKLGWRQGIDDGEELRKKFSDYYRKKEE